VFWRARNEEQLIANIGAADWSLSAAQISALEAASEVHPPYPVWHQRAYPVGH
jgi:aryl-alcohol dehydrogenase-like predicted oxidoreductase